MAGVLPLRVRNAALMKTCVAVIAVGAMASVNNLKVQVDNYALLMQKMLICRKHTFVYKQCNMFRQVVKKRTFLWSG